jgi:hypothetical protein
MNGYKQNKMWKPDLWQENQSLLECLCKLCVDYVYQNTLEDDVPFATFVKAVSVCQFVPQDVRIEMWIRHVILKDAGELLDEWVVRHFPTPGSNLHSIHILTYFAAAKDSANTPSYAYMVQDGSISEQELLLQQCMQVNRAFFPPININNLI